MRRWKSRSVLHLPPRGVSGGRLAGGIIASDALGYHSSVGRSPNTFRTPSRQSLLSFVKYASP
jgi:hypothetical protein